ncbi:Sperm surface protein Sp17, partial [Anthophora plagiata]
MSRTEYVIAPQIPRGLAPAIEGLAREILRERPRDIYTFAAEHFEGLLELRNKESRAGGIISNLQIVNCESLNEREPLFDSSTCCNNCDADSNDDDVKNSKHSKWMEERRMTKERVTSMMTIRRLPRKRREMINGSGSGWSINRAVGVFKRYDYEKE